MIELALAIVVSGLGFFLLALWESVKTDRKVSEARYREVVKDQMIAERRLAKLEEFRKDDPIG